MTEKVFLFLAEYHDSPQATAGLADEGEFIEVVQLSLSDAFSMIEVGTIIDMKTIILLQSLAMRQK